MMRSRTAAAIAGASLAVVGLTAAPADASPNSAQASCWSDCYSFTNAYTDTLALSGRDCDTCGPYSVWPGQTSHFVAGGISFYVPAGCVAKTSRWGSYWAFNGWHRFPHRAGQIWMKPSEKWRTVC